MESPTSVRVKEGVFPDNPLGGDKVDKYSWGSLSTLQLGRYAERLVKMEFILAGMDVFAAEVDDYGIDLVVRKDSGTHYDVQVKGVRGLKYVFMLKSKFALHDRMLLALAIFEDGSLPALYLIPSNRWLQPDSLFADRDYEGLKSQPEYGLNLSEVNMPLIANYRFERRVSTL